MPPSFASAWPIGWNGRRAVRCRQHEALARPERPFGKLTLIGSVRPQAANRSSIEDARLDESSFQTVAIGLRAIFIEYLAGRRVGNMSEKLPKSEALRGQVWQLNTINEQSFS